MDDSLQVFVCSMSVLGDFMSEPEAFSEMHLFLRKPFCVSDIILGKTILVDLVLQ